MKCLNSKDENGNPNVKANGKQKKTGRTSTKDSEKKTKEEEDKE